MQALLRQLHHLRRHAQAPQRAILAHGEDVRRAPIALVGRQRDEFMEGHHRVVPRVGRHFGEVLLEPGFVAAQSAAETEDAALAAIDAMMQARAFGDAGDAVVIEECLIGEEVSLFALCDGETALPLGAAQDHKRVGEGETGPNTGGMGSYAHPVVPAGAAGGGDGRHHASRARRDGTPRHAVPRHPVRRTRCSRPRA